MAAGSAGRADGGTVYYCAYATASATRRKWFSTRYGDYVDLATVEFLGALGFRDAVVSAELDYQVVKRTRDWKAPARFDQVLDVAVRAKQLGTASFTLLTEFRRAGAEAIIAPAETVYVLVDAKTLSKAPLPADLRAALERGAPGIAVDHAGYLHG